MYFNNIPKIVKLKMWEVHIGNRFKGGCYVCQKEINATNFQAGHIESEYAGGKISVVNLRPVCKKCNVQTGVFNMREIRNAVNPPINSRIDSPIKKLINIQDI